MDLSADFFFLKMSFQWNTEGFSCLYELSRPYNFISFYISLFSLSLLFADLRFSDILWLTMCLETCFGLYDSLTVVFSMETQPFINFLNLLASFPSSVVDMYDDVSCTLHSFLCMITQAIFIPDLRTLQKPVFWLYIIGEPLEDNMSVLLSLCASKLFWQTEYW